MIAKLFMKLSGTEKHRALIGLRRSDDGDCPIRMAFRGILNRAMLNLRHDPLA
jgi:hypothetical protein